MNVTECEIVSMPKATLALQGRDRIEVVYRITTDTQIINPYVVAGLAQAGVNVTDPLPKRYDRLTYRGQLFTSYVLSIDLAAEGHRKWTARVQCGQLPNNQTPPPDPENDNPLLRPLTFRIETAIVNDILEVDKDGKPVTNSAGDPFTSPIVIDDYYQILVVQKNFATLEEILDLGQQYKRTTNSAAFFGRDPKHVKWLPPDTGGQVTENGISYYPCTMRFAFSDRPFLKEVVDRGLRENVNGQLRPILQDGIPVTAPVLLDGAGAVLPQGQIGHVLQIPWLNEVDYNDLVT